MYRTEFCSLFTFAKPLAVFAIDNRVANGIFRIAGFVRLPGYFQQVGFIVGKQHVLRLRLYVKVIIAKAFVPGMHGSGIAVSDNRRFGQFIIAIVEKPQGGKHGKFRCFAVAVGYRNP
jgi:hypothetical protein